jgi:hypothetical protein
MNQKRCSSGQSTADHPNMQLKLVQFWCSSAVDAQLRKSKDPSKDPSFLCHSGLVLISIHENITGEALPGYLAYPVVARAANRLMLSPKIIMVGCNPLERTYSSYRYNYVQPTIELLKNNRNHAVLAHQPEKY